MLEHIKKSKAGKQSVLLFSSQMIGLLIGFGSNMLLAREMDPIKYGAYSLALAIISFLAIFFEFGYFASASKLLAQNRDKKKEKELIGASLFIVSIISFLFILVILLASSIADRFFQDDIRSILFHASIVSWAFVIPFFMDLVLKGSNEIKYLSYFHVVWKVLFTILILGLFFIQQLTPLGVLYSFSISCIISFLYFVLKLNPSFHTLKTNLKKIQKDNTSYGFHQYIGRVIDTSTYRLDKLLIGALIGSKEVGFYSLANAMANPINIFSASLSSSNFKKFSNGQPISKRILKINSIWVCMATLLANVLGYMIVVFFLNRDYHDVTILLPLMSIAVAFQASYQPYNNWLASNGYGKLLKKKAYYSALTNVILNFLLIPYYGAAGAVLASIVSMSLSYILHKYYYKTSLSLPNENTLS